MKIGRERELKLDVPQGFRLPDLPGEALPARRFTSTYYDTSSLSLARAGITLRLRNDNGSQLWHLKLPSRDGRLELEEPGETPGVPPRFVRLLDAHFRHDTPMPVGELRTHRSGVLVENGAAAAEVVLDAVKFVNGRRGGRSFAEVEIESRRGDLAAFGAVLDALRSAGARPSNGTPKIIRCLELPVAPTATTAIGRRIQEQVDVLMMHDPGTRLGADAEDLHDFRVAVRRLRALLRLARPVVDRSLTDPLRVELRWLGGLLGDVRDLDVLLEHLSAGADAFTGTDEEGARQVVGQLEHNRRTMRSKLLRALRSRRYFLLLDELGSVAASLDVARRPGAGKLARKELERLRRYGRSLDTDPSDAALHELRKRTKHARYAAELADNANVVKAAKRLQDVLGEHHDAIVAEAAVRTVMTSQSTPDVAFAGGRLVERERRRRARAAHAWPAAWARVLAQGRIG